MKSKTNYWPAGQMMGATVIEGVLRLAIVLIVATAPPLWIGVGLTVGLTAGITVYMSIWQRDLIGNRHVWSVTLTSKRLLDVRFILAMISKTEFAMFAWAIYYISPAIATIIFGVWPIMFILFLERSVSSQTDVQRYRRITVETVTLLAVAFTGLAFVVAAQSTPSSLEPDPGGSLLVGVVLAGLSSLFAAFSAFHYPWGMDLRRSLIESGIEVRDSGTLTDSELGTTMIGTILSTLVSIPLLIVLGISLSEVSISADSFLFSLVAGAALVFPLILLQRLSNLGTDNASVNAIAYLTPVVSLGLLALFGRLGGIRMDFVVMGTIAIVSMNLFLNFDPEERLGFNRRLSFKALLISFWAFGVAAYMRGSWLPHSSTTLTSGDYWGLLATIATVFTLILSFRVTRIHSRTTFEEYHTARLFRRLEHLVRHESIHRLSLRAVMRIDGTTDPHVLQQSYSRLRAAFVSAKRLHEADHSMQKELSEVEAEVDALVQSKQYGREFAELVAVVLLGLLTIGIALTARPDLEAWTAFLADVVSVVFASVIAFLVFNLVDLTRERATPFITSDVAHAGEFRVFLRQGSSPIVEQIVSIIVGVGMVVSFVVLFYLKWL